MDRSSSTAIFGGGCFWCLEAVFEQETGVRAVTSGYAGGQVPAPSYEQVCSGTTGHAEVVRVEYNAALVSYERLLELFWATHDPTQRDRQGADVGTQYRSVIFYTDELQRRAAERSKHLLERSGRFAQPIVTQIVEAGPFYEAEPNHQGFYRQNAQAPYCQIVIRPKLEKLGLAP